MTIEIYREDQSGDWRWRARAKNGRILADSAEGYRNRADLINALHILRTCFADARWDERG